MVALLNLAQRVSYSLKDDTDENPTEFVLRALTLREKGYIQSKTTRMVAKSGAASGPAESVGAGDVEVDVDGFEAARLYLMFSLVEVRGQTLPDGTLYESTTQTIQLAPGSYSIAHDPGFLDMLPQAALMELAAKAREISEVSQATAKN